jgi:hypothetical protein
MMMVVEMGAKTHRQRLADAFTLVKNNLYRKFCRLLNLAS